MSSAQKVGEIFSEAGAAFSRLGELTMQLHPVSEPSPSSGKWTDEELELLRAAVKRFGEDLHKISDVIKTRTVNQIRSALKKKVGADSEKRKQAQHTSIIAKSPVDSSTSVSADEPPLKKPKTETHTGDSLVDIEGLEDASPMKKIRLWFKRDFHVRTR
ncbi:BPTF-associated chromatin complex component 1-like isoform X2 [Amphiura filiformis]|uniref:BPTF-associated chromatin complex component 1-like isoform X2 n=1 Tax=Amphiura filiformis TaxID=82378 RepID=UPI003B219D17